MSTDRTATPSQPLNIAYAGIGLDVYWPQFPGLKEKLLADMAIVAGRLARPGVNVVNLGLVDTVDAAFEAGHACRRNEVDLIFLQPMIGKGVGSLPKIPQRDLVFESQPGDGAVYAPIALFVISFCAQNRDYPLVN